MKRIILAAALLVGGLSASPEAEAVPTFPLVLNGQWCQATTICDTLVLTFQQDGTGTADVTVAGLTQSVAFQWVRRGQRVRAFDAAGNQIRGRVVNGCLQGDAVFTGLAAQFQVCI